MEIIDVIILSWMAFGMLGWCLDVRFIEKEINIGSMCLVPFYMLFGLFIFVGVLIQLNNINLTTIIKKWK